MTAKHPSDHGAPKSTDPAEVSAYLQSADQSALTAAVLAQKMDAISRMFGGIARDLNNSLALVLGYCDFLLEQTDRENPIHRYAAEIKTAGEQAVDLTRHLMSFSVHRVFQPVVMDANGLVKEAVDTIRHVLSKDVDLKVSLTPEPCFVKVEPADITRVLVQFAGNARDAMPNRGTFSIATTVSDLPKSAAKSVGTAPGMYVSIRIADTGTGMDEAIRMHIFEPFFSTKSHNGHTGIGLFTAYAVVKRCGGTITFETRIGKGTAFTILLPLVERPRASAHAAEKPKSGKASVLIVEDDKHVRGLLCQMLSPLADSVIEAGNAQEALELLGKTKHVDLLITDMVMPGMNGRELGERAAKLKPGLRILYTSGYTDDEKLFADELALRARFLQKPFTLQQLHHMVRELLAH